MAKLILSMDGLVLKEIPLTKERTTIGRKPHNDIQIDNLAVSGEHAVIVTILNDSFLEDLGSTNGTVVNGNPVKKHFLQNNDVVELGKYKLKFIGDAAPAAAGEKADFEKTMVLRPSQMKAAAEQAKARQVRRRAAAQPPRWRSARPRCSRWRATATAAGIADKDAVKPAAPPPPPPPAPAAASAAAPATAPAPRPLPPPQRRRAARPAAGRDPAALGRERRQGARAHQAAHHARQAGRAGRGADAPPAGLLHHPRRGRHPPDGQRPGDRRRAAFAQGPRRDRAWPA